MITVKKQDSEKRHSNGNIHTIGSKQPLAMNQQNF